MLKKEDLKNLMDVQEAAQFLNISATKLRLMVATDEIPHVRIGRSIRFLPDELFKWAKRQSA